MATNKEIVMQNLILGLNNSERDSLITLKHWLEDHAEKIQEVLPMDKHPMELVQALSKAMSNMCKVSLLAEGSLAFGSPTAESYLPEGYNGPCAVEDINGNLIATLPNRPEAEKVARYCITPDGGYGSTVVKGAAASQVNYNSFESWLMR